MNRIDGIETSESGEPLQPIPMPCFQGRARVESRDSGDCPMSMTYNLAAGIGTYTQSGMTNYPGYPTPEMKFGTKWLTNQNYGNIVFYTHFPKDRNYDVCFRTKITRCPCRRRHEGSFLRAQKFGDLITAGTFTGTQSWYKILPLSGYKLILAELKLLRRRGDVYEKFLNRHKNQKYFTQTIH